MTVEPLSPDTLCWKCSGEDLPFETTADLPDLTDIIGQDRAVEALRFAVGMRHNGYNVFALGPEGLGKHTLVRTFFTEASDTYKQRPPDWCYVSNFKEARRPRAISLPPGRGAPFQADMARFVDDVRAALRAAFESEDFRTRQQVIEEEFREKREKPLAEIEKEAGEQGVAILRTPVGFAFGPVKDGKVISKEVFARYPRDEQERVKKAIESFEEKLRAALQQAPKWMKEAREKARQLNRETATLAVVHLVDDIRQSYSDLPEVLNFLDQVQTDVIENAELLIAAAETAPVERPGIDLDDGHRLLRRYRVNLIVHSDDTSTAPVIYEDDPTHERLVGRIDHRAEMGTLLTDLHMIRAGALHRANNGYLIVDARKLLTRPLAYESLKRALMARHIRIQPIEQAFGALSTTTLDPDPIPLDVKVALIGDRRIYYLLSEFDPEFPRLFKVAADFEEDLDRTSESQARYAELIATIARREELKPVDRGGVARAMEYSARRAGDKAKLSTEIEELADVLREANHLAGIDGLAAMGRDAIESAIAARDRRRERVRDRMMEQIQHETIMIATDGATAGQVNGLSVLQLGGYAFGRPSRITARVRLGRGEVVDIEREVELGGPLHSKGVLILSGYLSSHYAVEAPLSLSATIVFEQSYGGVEGDSASSAELYALLSAIADIPIQQSLAVTGSVNQRGEVQAIGGVNEKIEGFFDVCNERGLTGHQGVLIPASNVRHLMLNRRVVTAVEAGKFSVFPIKTIDEGIALLTGMPTGERDDTGRFPPGSLNERVEQHLHELAQRRKAFGATGRPQNEH